MCSQNDAPDQHDTAPQPMKPRVYRLSGDGAGRLALSMSPEWKALYFPAKDCASVEARVPDGHILGVRALRRRAWRVWLLTDERNPAERTVVWTMDITNTTGPAAALFALRKHGHDGPTTTVTADAAGNVLSIEDGAA